MDDGRGHLIPVPPEHRDAIPTRGDTTAGIFAVGDIVTIRGSRFEVKEIWPVRLVLRLLPREA